MALTGIYNSNDREIVLTPFQAQIFNDVIQYFRTNGVGGDNVFEDTYVLQKTVAEYIKENVTTGGGNSSSFILQVYNGVLGITPQVASSPAPAPLPATAAPAPLPATPAPAPESGPISIGGRNTGGRNTGGRNIGGETI